MKLSRIYSNKEEIFNSIQFNDGFNVVFAEIKHPKDKTKDSHNLGKSLLIELIDFMLLKKTLTSHFLKKHYDLFREFEFFLEIKLNNGKYLTIKRSVERSSKISFKLHDDKYQNFSNLNDSEWSINNEPFLKAIEKLDLYLGFDVCSEWSFRKGIGYFLRTQKDYQDVFQISKFQSGEHKEWKPYLGRLLGFNDKLISEKYELEKDKEKLENFKKGIEEKLYNKREDYDKLQSLIKFKESEIKEISSKIDKFDFHEREVSINTNLVEKVEKEISEFNNQLYNIKYDIEKINDSLDRKINFDLERIKKTFEEVEISFNEKIIKEYEDLLEFNKQILTQRQKDLKKRLNELNLEKESVLTKLKNLNMIREKNLETLRKKDSFDKFKEYQKELSKTEGEIQGFKNQLENLNKVIAIENEIEQKEKELETVEKQIERCINQGTEIAERVKERFTKIIKSVLFKQALLHLRINGEGNVEFVADFYKISGEKIEPTSESEGFTHKKLLCAAFDLAILIEYSNNSYFRFVYHDGILEAVDPRKKIIYLDLVKEYCKTYNIQYILTAIDSDLPRDENDNLIYFNESEIICKLSDEGNNGRLFKMDLF
ncbi:MAG: DUF2326 domain-containing protein [Candidatus Woesearchaeota archaeon]|jgi:uncharacterized protein YydD (DUF2326 family)|nr:DUF2326 domain-containing protein [Candidatus Woesearchaeota archaeon]